MAELFHDSSFAALTIATQILRESLAKDARALALIGLTLSAATLAAMIWRH